ncbi:trace amine-associated receptor 8c-like [Porites lutea]|uniref:trace amine-associated receptor 8c-like n=1 Tax=Porites lutea TaxID=51062 RepID=UPI003CC6CF66
MALKNFSKDENHKTVQELFCEAEFVRGVESELIFLSALNIFLSVTAFLGNTLILVALHKETSLHPPSKLLYRNLAITDLCVGIIVEPLFVSYWTSVVKERWDICYYAELAASFSGLTLCVVSLLTLTAISVDRLLALLLGLRYRQVVTYRRTCMTVTGFWILSMVGASTLFWNRLKTSWFQYKVAALCLVTTTVAYTKVFCTLRHNQIHVQNHVAQGQTSQAIPALNIARYRKVVYSALWVQGTLVICYLPYVIVVALQPQRGMSLSIYRAQQFTATLLYSNSSSNPLLYCWKIREVRQAVKVTLRQLFCRSS